MKLAFFGSPDFAALSLRALAEAGHELCLVVTQPARRRGRSKKLVPTEVARLAAELGAPVLEAAKLRKEPALVAEILGCGAELGVVVAYGAILPRKVFDGFPLGTINLHASLLPAWRGAAPIQWAVLNGDAETGVCVQRVVRKLDAGPVYAERRTPIAPDETAGALFDRLAPLGAGLLCEVVEAIGAGRAEATPQDASRATHAPKLSKADGWIPWERPAGRVVDFVRGMTPWPGARTLWQGKVLTVLAVEACAGDGPAGTLLAPADELRVACGEGAVRLRRLLPAGRKPMSGQDFARGRTLAAGDRFEAKKQRAEQEGG